MLIIYKSLTNIYFSCRYRRFNDAEIQEIKTITLREIILKVTKVAAREIPLDVFLSVGKYGMEVKTRTKTLNPKPKDHGYLMSTNMEY